jgi:hypothetical protein
MDDKDESENTGPDRMESEGGSQQVAKPELEAGCASCGSKKTGWSPPEGVVKDGTTYCSQACADSQRITTVGKLTKTPGRSGPGVSAARPGS